MVTFSSYKNVECKTVELETDETSNYVYLDLELQSFSFTLLYSILDRTLNPDNDTECIVLRSKL